MDRKALIRQYKETPRPMGVAVVRHRASGREFLFAGRDLPALMNRHCAQLRFGAHPNRALQQDWVAFGADAFEVAVLDTLTPPEDAPAYDPAADLAALEALWLEQRQPYEPAGYHRRPKARPLTPAR